MVLSKIDRSTLKGKRDYAIIVLMLTGGLRTMEVSRANYGDLSKIGDTEVLYVQSKGKVEKTDYVKISYNVSEAIREYISSLPYMPTDTSPLFVSVSNNSKSKRITTRSVSRVIKRALINSGFISNKLTAHSLRHTAVTLALLSGIDLQEVQQFARHLNITTTQIYAHNLERLNNESEFVISQAIF
jgi:integrase/recombinase XerC